MKYASQISLSFLLYVFSFSFLHADDKFYGSWEDVNSQDRLEILDGFKPNIGPALYFSADGSVKSAVWKIKDDVFTIDIGYSSYNAALDQENSLELQPKYGSSLYFNRIPTNQNTSENVVVLSDNSSDFLSKLQQKVWILQSNEKREVTFRPTFSFETGVVEFFDGDILESLREWSVASGIFKIDRDVIIEGRATDDIFIGLDARDKFIIFKADRPSQAQDVTDLQTKRSDFFDAFLTGEWQQSSYTAPLIRKFRPVYGDLKGADFTTQDGKLVNFSEWEYSPSTGVLKISGTEYISAMVVNDTLAFLDQKGNQIFLKRARESSDKRYSLSDVVETPLSENEKNNVIKYLSPQFRAIDRFQYQFEFLPDGRSGFFHKWQSTPFVVTGETLHFTDGPKPTRIYSVEDFVIFDAYAGVFQLDGSESRLRPKTDDEAKADLAIQEALGARLVEKSIHIKISLKDGSKIDIPIPNIDFSDVGTVSLGLE